MTFFMIFLSSFVPFGRLRRSARFQSPTAGASLLYKRKKPGAFQKKWLRHVKSLKREGEATVGQGSLRKFSLSSSFAYTSSI
jgi:hypothetical protein